MTKLGILGLGKMGSAFALNLLSKGHEVHVYNRSKERLRELVAKGAIAHPSPYELGKSVDVVITSLTDQDVVEDIVMGKDGALHGMKRGALWVEMSTIDPDASVRQAGQANKSPAASCLYRWAADLSFAYLARRNLRRRCLIRTVGRDR